METKRSIVNHMLATVGERRVLTLETGHPSVFQAVQALDGYDLDFQLQGYWFNTNYNQTLVHDNRGEILLPNECLSFQITAEVLQQSKASAKMRYVRRSGKIYDAVLNTFNIGKPLVADIVVRLDIEDIPPVAQRYLKHYAAVQYYVDDDGDTSKASLLQYRVDEAKAALNAEIMRVMNTNSLQSPAAQNLLYRIQGNGAGSGYAGNPFIPGGGR